MRRGSRRGTFLASSDRRGDRGIFADDDFEGELSDGDVIARRENALPLDPLAVDERPVCASEVAKPDREVVDREHAMMATDEVAVGAQVTVLFAPDKKLADIQRNRLSLLPALENLQLHLKHGVGAPTAILCTDPDAASGATE
jgi:hypothetical protein